MSLLEVPQAPSSERPANWRAGLGTGFWALCAGTFINRAGTMVVPFMTLYLVSARGFSVVAAGEVVAGFGGGAIIAPLIGGALADHVGRRITLLTATLITAAIMVALAYVRSTALIVALVLLLGVGLEAPRATAGASTSWLVCGAGSSVAPGGAADSRIVGLEEQSPDSDEIAGPRPKRYDVLAGIELAPPCADCSSRGNPGFSSPGTRLESCPPFTWIAAATRHLFRVVLRAQPLNTLRSSSSYAVGVDSPARHKPKSMLSTRNVSVPSSAKPAAHGPLGKTASRSGRAFWSVAATCHGLRRRIPVGCSLPLIASLNSRMPLPSARPVWGRRWPDDQ